MDLLPTGPDSVGPYRLLHRLGTGGQGTVYSDSGVVDGPLLQEWVRGAGPRGGAALERLAVDTVTALAAIHRAEVVHRDVKPGNVLLGPDGPVVIDFGIARALDLNQSIITGQAVGTPGYMAPEQIAEEATGPAADMFAWGATMVFAATGERAFRGGSIPAVTQAILREEPELHRPDRPPAEAAGRDAAAMLPRATSRNVDGRA